MILLIDNYDSFTYNLAHLVAEVDDEIIVKRNDEISVDEALAIGADAIVVSPGPSTPDNAGICLELIRAAGDKKVPIFGVCLGMQSLVQAFGGEIVRAGKLMHGKTSNIVHQKGGRLFRDIESPFLATRYHSLVAKAETVPACFMVTARSEDDGEIMAVEHKELPLAGVQFHPESIRTPDGRRIIKNFLAKADATP